MKLLRSIPPMTRPFAWTAIVLGTTTFVIIPAAFIFTLLSPYRPGSSPFSASIFLLTLGSVFGITHFVLRLYHRRLLRSQLQASRFALCGVCGFNLRGNWPATRCPECGTHYHVPALVAFWKSFTRQTTLLHFMYIAKPLATSIRLLWIFFPIVFGVAHLPLYVILGRYSEGIFVVSCTMYCTIALAATTEIIHSYYAHWRAAGGRPFPTSPKRIRSGNTSNRLPAQISVQSSAQVTPHWERDIEFGPASRSTIATRRRRIVSHGTACASRGKRRC